MAKQLKFIRSLNWKDSYMWERLPTFIREWSILILGILLIVPFLYLSFQEAPSSKSIASAPSLSQNDGPADRPVAANAPAPSAPTPAKPAQGSAQAPAKAPAMSHEHMAAAPAAPPAQTVGQTTPKVVSAAVSGDVAAGKLVFRKCQACHSLDAGKNGLGPSLAGIVGKKSGSAPSFNYSPAMKGSNLTWDVATLNTYLS
ncbi:MAG: c-type cytochrome, partial [Pseudolabrys sp.]